MNPPSESTLAIIARALEQKYGQSYADAWLRQRLCNETEKTPPAPAPDVLSQPLRSREPKKPYTPPDEGADALRAAEQLIGEEWRMRLGRAYPLVLLAIKGALEAGIDPDGEDARDYHFLTTMPTLTALSSVVLELESSLNQRTIERWLAPTAPHAAALRCWLGWKTWYTRTYIDYKTGEPKCTPGGTVFRVYLNPLSGQSSRVEQRIFPLSREMKRDWRDLEADRHGGRTLGRRYERVGAERVYPHDVGIDKSNKSLSEKISGVWLSLYNTSEQSSNLGEEYYLYPDMRTVEGCLVLREDVNRYAEWLARLVTQQEDTSEVIDRYRQAVWVSVKAELYGETRRGWELLSRFRRLALELRRERHTLRDPPAWCWAQVERAGLSELRRDYSWEKGRFYRVMSKRAAVQLGILA